MFEEVLLGLVEVAEMRTQGISPKALIPSSATCLSRILLASASLLDLFRAPGAFIRSVTDFAGTLGRPSYFWKSFFASTPVSPLKLTPC